MRTRHAGVCLFFALALGCVWQGAATASTASSPHVLTFQQVRVVACGSPGAVKYYDRTASCVRLGHVVLGPGAFTLARRLPDGAMGSTGGTPPGPWIEVVISGGAKATMERALIDPGEANRPRRRFDFVFDGEPLHGDIGGDGVSVFLLAPDARTARNIVSLVCHAGCHKPFPGPTG